MFSFRDEKQLVQSLAHQVKDSCIDLVKVRQSALEYAVHVRGEPSDFFSLERSLIRYPLSSEEGMGLMILSEALLRVPDSKTASALLRSVLRRGSWKSVHSSDLKDCVFGYLIHAFSSLCTTLPVFFRVGQFFFKKLIIFLGSQFVLAENIALAIEASQDIKKHGCYAFSYDCLGEAALTMKDAESYFSDYLHALSLLPENTSSSPYDADGISVKLSALHPCYEEYNRQEVLSFLVPRLLQLCIEAAKKNIPLTIDAEEDRRWELCFSVIEGVLAELGSYPHWEGFGCALQAYRCAAVECIDRYFALFQKFSRPFHIRLVKGAYWDSEIKKAQELSIPYPVFTSRDHTDISYMACALKLVRYAPFIYPQFAGHNAFSLAYVIELCRFFKVDSFEIQCLFGMGRALHQLLSQNVKSRIYAPVGSYKNLLPYLVRRLLENGASGSFVHKIFDRSCDVKTVVYDPIAAVETDISQCRNVLFEPFLDRKNSVGINLDSPEVLEQLKRSVCSFHVPQVSFKTIDNPMDSLKASFKVWSSRTDRIQWLTNVGDLLQSRMVEAISILVHEAHKTYKDALAEVREAIDFCYYYAKNAQKLLISPLKSYTGEIDALLYAPRGIFACISPWNFPLAIFWGQISAALVVGNVVIAKPASQTRYIAQWMYNLAVEAGMDPDALVLFYDSGAEFSRKILEHSNLAGCVFTGSTEVAKNIQRVLSQSDGEIIPFIAETGGLNVMILDSTVLIEPVVKDIIQSAFGSAGQRCSALRVLYVQKDVMEPLLEGLKGAVECLRVGDARDPSIDVSVMIDSGAADSVRQHVAFLEKVSQDGSDRVSRVVVADSFDDVRYVSPQAWLVKDHTLIDKEVFGPVLHILSYSDVDEVLDVMHSKGYGLTMGLCSRNQDFITYVQSRAHVGNLYVNRNMVGAVVGVQPFGGEGLSGTGPKAGGPNYLLKFVHERVVSVNIASCGGNVELLTHCA